MTHPQSENTKKPLTLRWWKIGCWRKIIASSKPLKLQDKPEVRNFLGEILPNRIHGNWCIFTYMNGWCFNDKYRDFFYHTWILWVMVHFHEFWGVMWIRGNFWYYVHWLNSLDWKIYHDDLLEYISGKRPSRYNRLSVHYLTIDSLNHYLSGGMLDIFVYFHTRNLGKSMNPIFEDSNEWEKKPPSNNNFLEPTL